MHCAQSLLSTLGRKPRVRKDEMGGGDQGYIYRTEKVSEFVITFLELYKKIFHTSGIKFYFCPIASVS